MCSGVTEGRNRLFDSAYFDAGIDRAGTQSVKWSLPGLCAPGVVPLWVADMDFRCAPAISEALSRRAAHASYGYTYVDGEDRQAVCDYWQRRHGVRLKPEEVGLLPSVVTGLRVCVEQLSRPGEGVILQSPVYGPFYSAIEALGRRVMDAPLSRDAEGRYAMDLERVEDRLREGARLMLLCSPHNPVARCYGGEELSKLIGLLRRYGAALVSDEIHADFVYEPLTFCSALRFEDPGIRLVALSAPSKTFNVAGLKQASLFCRDQGLMRDISRTLERYGVEAGNLFALTAARAAYTLCDDWLEGLLAYLDGNRRLLREELGRLLPEARLSPIEATYLAWVDVSACGLDDKTAYARCREAGVLPTEGEFFGRQAGQGFMRINFGCPAAQLREGLARFAGALKG